MISWLFESSLLATSAMIIYLIAGRRMNRPGKQRTLLLFSLAISIVLPVIPFSSPADRLVLSMSSDESFNFQTVHMNPANETVEEFCHCTDPGTSVQIMFQSKRGYEFLIEHRENFKSLFFLVAGMFMVFLILKIARLLIFTRRKNIVPLFHDGKNLRLLFGKNIRAAASFRLFHSYLLFGNRFRELPPESQNALMAHEISHVRQLNTWENIGMSLLQSFWFFLPAYYFFKRELRLLSEFIADDAGVEAIGNETQYAHLLIDLKSGQSSAPGSDFSGGFLKARIRRLSEIPEKRRGISHVPAMALILLVLPLTYSFSRPQFNSQEQEFLVYSFLRDRAIKTGSDSLCRECTMKDLAQVIPALTTGY